MALIYTALTEATALATGKPVEELSNYLIREMLDSNAPPQALDLLRSLSHDEDDRLQPYSLLIEMAAFPVTAH
jgi:hypothetical protein